jgi:hypothetical protein
LGFIGQRGKALDHEIHGIVKFDIPKGKENIPNVSWVLIEEFMMVNNHAVKLKRTCELYSEWVSK